MSEIEIKQLLDGDEQFYPQTDLHALVNDGEYAIDNVPTIDSSNLVTSSAVFKHVGSTIISGSKNISTSDNVIFDLPISIPSGTELFINIIEGIGTAASYVTLAIDNTGGWRLFNKDEKFTVDRNCTKLRLVVQTPHILDGGGNVSAEISFVANISEIKSLEKHLSSLNAQVANDENNISSNTDSINSLKQNIGQSFTISVFSSKKTKTPATLKAGQTVLSITGYSYQLYGRTNQGDPDYIAITPNVPLTRDVNYITHASVDPDGEATITLDTFDNDVKNLKQWQLSDADVISNFKINNHCIRTDTYMWYYRGQCLIIPVNEGDNIIMIKKAGSSMRFGFITNNNAIHGTDPGLIDSLYYVNTGNYYGVAPTGAKYLYYEVKSERDVESDGASAIYINDYNVLENVRKHVEQIESDLRSSAIIDFYNEDITIESIRNDSTALRGYINNYGLSVDTDSYKHFGISLLKGEVLYLISNASSAVAVFSEQISDISFKHPIQFGGDYDSLKPRIFIAERDIQLCVCYAVNENTKIYKISGLDIKTNDILKVKSLDLPLEDSNNLFSPLYAKNSANLNAGNGALENSGARWVSAFIKVDTTKGRYLNCSSDIKNNGQFGLYRVSAYDAEGNCLLVGPSQSPANINFGKTIPLPVNAAYIRINCDGRAFPFEEINKIRLSYTNNISNIPRKIISDDELHIVESQRFDLNSIIKYSANIVYGSYVSASAFNDRNGNAVILDTKKIYIDDTTEHWYSYKVTNEEYVLVDNGIYDGSSQFFTETFTFFVEAGKDWMKNMIVSSNARYFGDTVPTIHFFYSEQNVSYPIIWGSMLYTIGRDRGYENQEWRVPPFYAYMRKLGVTITIPEGTILCVRDLSNYFDDKVKQWVSGLRFNGHNTYCPDQSVQYFELCAKLGYPCCITIPKVTHDGVFVCYHDDDKITRYARREDGTALTNEDLPAAAAEAGITSIESCPINYFTYEELMAFDFGAYKGPCFRGTKIAKVEEFFAICAKTGMHPMFSIHPNLNDVEWGEIKVLAKNYGLLQNLNLKFASRTYMSSVYAVFGADVESYTLDWSTDSDATNILDAETKGWEKQNIRIGIEYFYPVISKERIDNALGKYAIHGTYVSDTVFNDTQGQPVELSAADRYLDDHTRHLYKYEQVEEQGVTEYKLVDYGYTDYFVACANFIVSSTESYLDAETYKRLISWGVTEFTEDGNTSFGLNW